MPGRLLVFRKNEDRCFSRFPIGKHRTMKKRGITVAASKALFCWSNDKSSSSASGSVFPAGHAL